MTTYYVGVEEDGEEPRSFKEASEAIQDGDGPVHVWSSGPDEDSPWDTTEGRVNVDEAAKNRPPAACGASGFTSRVVFVSTVFGSVVPDLVRAPVLCEECREAVIDYFHIPDSVVKSDA